MFGHDPQQYAALLSPILSNHQKKFAVSNAKEKQYAPLHEIVNNLGLPSTAANVLYNSRLHSDIAETYAYTRVRWCKEYKITIGQNLSSLVR
ncbi:hypothetical protein G9A89_002931 [Geosiphon pyriformis]|nr:hypothetical protein G9A89_002931 [Geosiphon pyriformis]